MERPALFVGDAEEGEATLNESQARQSLFPGIFAAINGGRAAL